MLILDLLKLFTVCNESIMQVWTVIPYFIFLCISNLITVARNTQHLFLHLNTCIWLKRVLLRIGPMTLSDELQ